MNAAINTIQIRDVQTADVSVHERRSAGFYVVADWQRIQNRQNLRTRTGANPVPWRVFFCNACFS